eukprot:TRINITY_DN22410_c0_g2_i3.p1 TRINITY_DN22410_c0_g2~~TRINITY_DN22410_c0_g2_i3.p1  ORF type:complete len:1399 (-),score=279.90 TRINITY_DN22410_c0_g2_i3:463-4191(-)
MDELAGVDRSFWPPLLTAAQAEAGVSDAASNPSLGGYVSRAAKGLKAWRQALAGGHLWSDEVGANWPASAALRKEWSNMLLDLDMPRFTAKYPQLIDPLMQSLLEAVPRFEELRNENEIPEPQPMEAPEDQDGQTQQQQQSSESQGQGGDGGEGGGSEDMEGASSTVSSDSELAAEAMSDVREQWEQASESLREAEEALGEDAADMVADDLADGKGKGKGTGGQGLWQESKAWQDASDLQGLLKRHPELRKLIRELGRRSAKKGPLRNLPEEVYHAGSPKGVIRSELVQEQTTGIALSGDLSRMMPSEMRLLVKRKSPALKMLYHSKRIERSLLCYDRSSWFEDDARPTGKMELRPAGEAGPLILCLDTSGSMCGPREMVGKALVLEGMRQAHKQRRRCYLYAFSSKDELEEFDLEMSPVGMRNLLEFLGNSFQGGTSLDAALSASVGKLTAQDAWRNADLLVVTDGEIPRVDDDVLEELEKAKEAEGAKVVGIVLSDETGQVMESVCTDLYTTGDPFNYYDGSFKKLLRSSAEDERSWLNLRKVATKSVVTAALPCQGASRLPGGSRLCGAAAGGAGSRHLGLRLFARSGGTSVALSAASRSSSSRSGQSRKSVEVSEEQLPPPDFDRFSSGLMLVIKAADEESKGLGMPALGTDALLLGVLAAPVTSSLVQTLFDGKPDSQTQVVECARELLRQDNGASRSPSGGGPLLFTPMAQRALLEAQDEQETLGHTKVEPAHLLLALLRDSRGRGCEILGRLGADLMEIRGRVLDTLTGTFAGIKREAMRQLEAVRMDFQASRALDEVVESQARLNLAGRLKSAHQELTHGLVERSVESKLLLLAALAGEHVFFLGPPGTAKSLLARRLADVCSGSFFELLLTRFTVPEEVFGPLSLQALERDELLRKTEGFLPEAEVAFLDEVFKANSSILNALLTLLNERAFDNGGRRHRVPLWCAVAASNELPEGDELEALYDRFLIRRQVPRISENALPQFLRAALSADASEDILGDADSPKMQGDEASVLSAQDSRETCVKSAEEVEFPDHLLQLVGQLRAYLRDEMDPPIEVSDRRMGKAVRFVRTAAYAAGGTEVSEVDLLLLKHVFWVRDPEESEQIKDWLLRQFVPEQSAAGGVPQAWHIWQTIRQRLYKTVTRGRDAGQKQTEMATALRDLAGVRAALQEEVLSMLRRKSSLQYVLSGGADGFRTFWLETGELSEAEALRRGGAEARASLASPAAGCPPASTTGD